jgi:peptidoglycan/LPS O-acetylase OafA/YrhL
MNLRVLDGLRGIAALYVVLHHASRMLWTGAPAAGSSLAWGIESFFSFGHQAVLLFFLISGFCIHHRQAQQRATRIPVAGFAWRRLRRLYPPLVLALIVTAALDHFGAQLSPQLYTEPSNYWRGPITVGSSYSLQTLVGNLAFQARLSVPELGSNSPLWSLAFEFWFYALYPLLLAGFARVGSRRTVVAIGVVSAASWFLLGWWPLPHLRVLSDWAVWAFGALLAEAHARGERPRVVRWCGPLAPALLVALACISPVGP